MPTYDEKGALLVSVLGSVAPVGASYVVMGLDGTLTNERVLTGTANQVIVTDGGAGGPATLSTPQDIATTSSPTFANVYVPDTGFVGIVGNEGIIFHAAADTIEFSGCSVNIGGAIADRMLHLEGAEPIIKLEDTTSGEDWLLGGSIVGGEFSIRNNFDNPPSMHFDTSLRVGIGTTSPSRRLQVVEDSASANVIIPIARLESQVSGGAGAAGHGPGLEFYGESTTTEDQSMVEMAARWSVATHASRRARIEFRAAYIGTDVLVGVVEAPEIASADGNPRGVGAVDWQGARTNVTEVASGNYSVISGGFYNEASGSFSTVGGGQEGEASGSQSTVPGGYRNTASGDFSFAAGEEATASHNDSFVWSSTAATVSWGISTWAARTHGGARFYSAAGVGTGVQLTAGGNAWAAISARAAKENFRPVEGILAKVAALPIYDYNLKSQSESVRHVGPVAEEFNEIFGFTEAPGYINTLDVSGVNLAAIKAMLERIERMEEKLQ